MKMLRNKTLLLSLALIVLSIIAWLYGDYYGGGAALYIWGGVGLIALGTLIWLYLDFK
jgi:hypothetical protein